jgi:hypothetical protein
MSALVILGTNMSDFNHLNTQDGVYLLTAQNKSIDGLTLTGSWYYAPDYLVVEDLNILWVDAKTAVAGLNVALQGGTVLTGEPTIDETKYKDTTAFGAKVGGTFNGISASVAYSSVDDGNTGVFNVGGVKTPLYTQMILNQGAIKKDSDTFVFRAGVKALGGKFGLAYNYSDQGAAAVVGPNDTYTELDLTYKTKVNNSTTLFAGYVYTDLDDDDADAQNLVRVWGRYNF